MMIILNCESLKATLESKYYNMQLENKHNRSPIKKIKRYMEGAYRQYMGSVKQSASILYLSWWCFWLTVS